MEVEAAAYGGHPDGGDTGASLTTRTKPGVTQRTEICSIFRECKIQAPQNRPAT